MINLSREVRSDIRQFITVNLEDFKQDAIEFGGLDITIACNDQGDAWNYQTGDNSYTGNAYGLNHWAIDTIDADTDASELYASVRNQLEDLLNQ